MAQYENLTGRHFGKSTVIERDFENTKSGTWWICKCDCGKVRSANASELKRGRNKCDCEKRQPHNLEGQRFGKWTVLKRASIDSGKVAKWMCRCDCGIEKEVFQISLLQGTSTSCGCYQKEYIVGKNKRNRYDLSGECGKGYACNTGAEFLFDLEDYDKIKDIRWVECSNRGRYNGIKGYDSAIKGYVKMSWVVFEKGADHINHNTLDNRKSNLRSATIAQNAANRGHQKSNKSGVIGVCRRNDGKGRWIANIRRDKKLRSKSFQNFEDAVKARLKWEKELFGEYAPQKHLYEKYGIEV